MKIYKRAYGFTIVELLIVIVVVAILASLSYVGYVNVANRSNDSAISSDLSNFAKKGAIGNFVELFYLPSVHRDTN